MKVYQLPAECFVKVYKEGKMVFSDMELTSAPPEIKALEIIRIYPVDDILIIETRGAENENA